LSGKPNWTPDRDFARLPRPRSLCVGAWIAMSIPRVGRSAASWLAALAFALGAALTPGCASWTIPEQEFRDSQPAAGRPTKGRPTAQFGSSDKAKSIESNVGIH
jgi:hypothetical protein